ncbi:MAG: hypothetical protein CMJ94_14090 [Planctomycetes bacterium]|nr:hypothetical protein [Planctomycetota bacterium]
MVRALLSLALAVVLSAGAAAQTTWYVDPASGNNTNTGTSAGDAFLSITHALSQGALASGDTIVLNGGIYNANNGTNGSGNLAETFPLQVPSGVSLVAGSVFSEPVIDGATTGGNSSFLLTLSEDISAITEIAGITFENCGNAIWSFPASNSIRGLVIDSCTFRNFTGAAIELALRGGLATDSFVVANCTLTGSSAFAGIQVVASDATVLDGGSIQDCTVAGCGIGIDVFTEFNGTIDRDFLIARNTVSGFTTAGIQLRAFVGDSTNTATVRGNIILGDGVGASNEAGLSVRAENTLGAGSPSVVDGLIAFNDFSRSNVNIKLETTGGAAGSTRVESVFAGNLIRNAVEYGVQVLSFINDGGMAPDFGGKVGGSANAGRNTFENPTATWEVGLDPEGDISGPIAMAENFWLDGLNPQTRTELVGPVNYPSFLPILSNNLIGSLSRAVIQAGQAEVITIALSAGRFVVQVDETFVADVLAAVGEFGQYKSFEIVGPDGNIEIEPIDLQLVAVNGTELSFNLPGLAAGNYTINFTNPGFQQLVSLGLRVTSGGGGGGGGGGGCVVATAAHGDYNAPEVRILREFRDRYLLPHASGRQAVRAYYQHGGPVAVWIAQRDWAKSATRAALAVPTGIAWTLLHWNPGQRLLAAVLLLGASFSMFRRRA